MGLSKGIRLTKPRDFFTQRFGEGAWEALVAGMSSRDAAVLRAVVTTGWYEDALHGRLIRAGCERFGGAGVAEELGRFEAEHDLSTGYRWFLRLVKPSFAVRNMNLYWCRFHDTGRWTSEVNGPKLTARLDGWSVVDPLVCRCLQGYLGRMLELFGSEEVIIVHPLCRARGDDRCEFRTTRFRANEWARKSGSAIQSSELSSVLYELAHLKDLEALADAVVELLHNRLSFSHVALWARVDPGGELRLLRSSGATGVATPRCFVLETGGRPVGRLDVEVPTDREDAAVLEQLLSGIGIALGSAGAPLGATLLSAANGVASSPEEVGRCVAAAAQRWALTPRQGEVLELLVRGWTNKEIAGELGCQEGTVEVHVSQALRKSTAPNRAGLVAKILAGG